MMNRLALAAALTATLALAACQFTGGGDTRSTAADSDAAYSLSARMAETIGRCWFAQGETAFAGYIYSPERNAGQSRILIVRQTDPTGLPALVIDATGATSADVYGPLATSPNGARIRADVDRWARGGTGCA